jgi:hypothetical protein
MALHALIENTIVNAMVKTAICLGLKRWFIGTPRFDLAATNTLIGRTIRIVHQNLDPQYNR